MVKDMTGLEKIKFSVSMCVYAKDNPSWFKTAVDSILNQTVKPDEVVLVVDGPVPDVLDNVIGEYEKLDLFSVIRLPENVGHGEARRIGLANCKYEYVALMDADDISLPGRLRHQFDYMETYNYIDILSSSMNIMGTQNNLILQNLEITIEMLMHGNFLLHPCIIMRTESIRKKHPYLYESSYDKAEDYKFYCTAILNKLRLFSESTIVLSYNQPKTDQISQKEISSKVKMWIRTEYLKMIKE